MEVKEIREIGKGKSIDARVGHRKEGISRDYKTICAQLLRFPVKGTCAEDCHWKEDCLNGRLFQMLHADVTADEGACSTWGDYRLSRGAAISSLTGRRPVSCSEVN